jgi:hypothetical protein
MANAKNEKLTELILQALETEIGGVGVYEAAIECARNSDLRDEWEEYLEQTRHHVNVVKDLCARLEVDPKTETAGREVVRHLGRSLVQAILKAKAGADPAAAQIVAAECVVLAETKDHENWELLAESAKQASGDIRAALEAAVGEIEDQEDEHLYHTKGWTRELWLEDLGLPCLLPPPEERKGVKTAIGAERAKQQRGEML